MSQHNEDENKIHQLLADWCKATESGDLETIKTLMTPDIIFLTPGQPPMTFHDFLTRSSDNSKLFKIGCRVEVKELQVTGDLAYAWNYVRVEITPSGKEAIKKEGNVLSVYKKSAEGKWQLFRDANLLA
eukprot:Phypoly_transcript_24834.p1 GENE.Phypoly_transcript_24834~~Phypoly_transcript_24834.p1  ORF type:complete len:141 (+),score=27.04 Phypoly_transcript_24834:38-424(+)